MNLIDLAGRFASELVAGVELAALPDPGPWGRAVLELMLNGVWQGLLLALLTGLALRSARRVNAATRHAVWCAVLVAALLLPLAAGRLIPLVR